MGRPIRILVIEDEEAIREGLIDVLVFHKYEVDSAATGPEGLAKAQTGKFDLILLDIAMPEMDGLAATKTLREKGHHGRIAILSAHTDEESRTRALEAGCDVITEKPMATTAAGKVAATVRPAFMPR